MNKFVKCVSLMSMVGAMFLASGCSCSVKQDKIDASADAIKQQELYMNGEDFVDFTSTLKITEITYDGVETSTTVVVKRDIEGKRDVYEVNIKSKTGDEDPQDVLTESQEVYVENGIVYIKEINDNITAPYATNYASTSAIFMNANSFVNKQFTFDYYEASEGFHNTYKWVPYNGCSSASKDEENGQELKKQLPDIAPTTTSTLTCEVEKKLFKKDYTYTLFYRVNPSQLANITIHADKDNRITSVIREDSIAVGNGKINKQIQEFTITYGDVQN